MVEQRSTQETLASERALINPVVEWLYGADEQACPPRNQLALERAQQLGLDSDELRILLAQTAADDKQWLAFHLAGLDDDAFTRVDPDGERHAVLAPLYETMTQVAPPEVSAHEPEHAEPEEVSLPGETPATKTARAAMKRAVTRAPRRERQSEEAATETELDESDEESEMELGGAEGRSMTTDLVRQYMQELRKIPLLSAEEEVELGNRIEAGLAAKAILEGVMSRTHDATDEELEWLATDGQNAQEHMTRANLRLVVSIAKRYTGRELPFLDLIQEGNAGLMHAIEKFDYTKGFKFSTYATWWIRQRITRAIVDQGQTIRLPVYFFEKRNKLLATRSRLLSASGVEPTDEQLAQEAEMTPEQVREILHHARPVVSLDMPVGDESGDTTLGDLLFDGTLDVGFEALQHSRTKDVIMEVLETLSDRERYVITERLGFGDGIPKTLDTVGRELGLTRERVRQIEAKTKSKLRHPSRSGRLRMLLGE